MPDLQEVPKDSWAWQVLEELDSALELNSGTTVKSFHDGLVIVEKTSPSLPEGVSGMLFVRKRIFVDKNKLKSPEGNLFSAIAAALDVFTLQSVSFSLALTLIRVASMVKFLDADEHEFLEVFLSHITPPNSPHTTGVNIKTLARSYAIPENYINGFKRVKNLVTVLRGKGVLECRDRELSDTSIVYLCE